MQRWWWLFVLIMTGWSAGTFLSGQRWGFGLAVLLLGLVIAWWISPWRGGRTLTHAQVEAMEVSQRPVVVYWRPGCQYCARLRSAMRRHQGDGAHWVNIWQDRDAAAFVRSVNDGNETVPTVMIDEEAHTNPEPALVLARLSS